MAKYRKNRLSTEMKREVADIVQHELKDPRLGMVSITGMEVAGDLACAKVFFSCLGGETQRTEIGKVLNGCNGLIRSKLAGRLGTRTVPELTFLPDSSIEYGMKIDKILSEVIPPAAELPTDEAGEDGGDNGVGGQPAAGEAVETGGK